MTMLKMREQDENDENRVMAKCFMNSRGYAETAEKCAENCV